MGALYVAGSVLPEYVALWLGAFRTGADQSAETGSGRETFTAAIRYLRC